MNKANKYSPEVRERAIRLVQEARKDYPSLWSAIESIAPKIGCAAVPAWLNLLTTSLSRRSDAGVVVLNGGRPR